MLLSNEFNDRLNLELWRLLVQNLIRAQSHGLKYILKSMKTRGGDDRSHSHRLVRIYRFTDGLLSLWF